MVRLTLGTHLPPRALTCIWRIAERIGDCPSAGRIQVSRISGGPYQRCSSARCRRSADSGARALRIAVSAARRGSMVAISTGSGGDARLPCERLMATMFPPEAAP